MSKLKEYTFSSTVEYGEEDGSRTIYSSSKPHALSKDRVKALGSLASEVVDGAELDTSSEKALGDESSEVGAPGVQELIDAAVLKVVTEAASQKVIDVAGHGKDTQQEERHRHFL